MALIHFVALGGNLPSADGAPALAACEAACGILARWPGVVSACRSRWFSAAPIPASKQPRFINGMVRIEAELTPEALLQACHAIEAWAGRARSVPDAARTLDVDIIDMGGLVRSGPDPVLPHPRAHLRAFVLLPLRDVAPGWVHPVSGKDIGSLLAGLEPQDIRPA